MTAIVTENWSGRRWSPGKGGQREWVVTGVASQAAAIAAVGADVSEDATFPQDDRLPVAGPPDAINVGPAAYKVTQAYAFLAAGSPPPNEGDPLARPPRVSWGRGALSDAADADADGRVILNSAGLPYSPGPPLEQAFRILTMTRWEGRYDVALADSYDTAVNTDNVLIPLSGTVEPGQMLLVSYLPLSDYDARSRYVQVAYTFWVGRRNRKDSDGLWDCWKFRLRDQSFTGWYSDGGTKATGHFVNAKNYERVTEPVLLDGTGLPLLAGKFKVEKKTGEAPADPVTPPTALDAAVPRETVAGGSVFLKFSRTVKRPYSGLNLF